MARGTVNKTIILGRLGQDPEIRTTASGTQVANLNVATTEMGPKDQAGNRQEQTEWHRIILFGKTAEIAGQYLQKGSQVYIEGRLQTRKWQDQNGQDRYSTEIVANEMQFIGGKPEGQGQQNYQQPQQGYQQPAPQPQAQGNVTAAMQQRQPAPQQPAPAQQPAPQGFGQPTGQPAPAPQGFDDIDDKIPF